MRAASVLAALAVTGALTAGCGGSSRSASPAPPKPEIRSFAVQDPLAVVPDAGGAWVLTLAGALVRIDARTGEVGVPHTAGSEKHYRDLDALARDGDTLWLADETHGLMRFDARTGEPRGGQVHAGRPTAVVVADGAVWVAEAFASTLRRVSPRTGKATRPLKVGTTLRSVAASGGRLWAVDETGGALYAVDPGTRHVSAPAAAGSTKPFHATPVGGTVWLCDDDGATLFDAATLRPRARWQAGVSSHPVVAADGTGAWGVSNLDPTLFHLGGDGHVTGRIALPRPGIHVAVAPDHALWVVADGGPVMRIARSA